MRRRVAGRWLLAAILAGAAACGGGGGGGSNGPTAPSTGIAWSPSHTAGADSLSLQAASGTSASTLVLELRAQEMADLYGLAFDLQYPSSLLSLEGVTEGTMLSQNGAVPTSLQVAENPPGRLVVGLSRLGNIGGATGSGVVLTLRFRATASGNGAMSFSENQSFSSGGVASPGVDWIGGTVRIVL